MGYNACYGLPVNDSMSRYEVKSKDGETLQMFDEDCQGNLLVKQEVAICARCGAPLFGGMAYLHGTEEICKKCEVKHRMKNKNKNKKAVTK